MRYALINSEDNVVSNVIELEEGAEWAPPEGSYLVPSDTANIGDLYIDGEFVRPL